MAFLPTDKSKVTALGCLPTQRKKMGDDSLGWDYGF